MIQVIQVITAIACRGFCLFGGAWFAFNDRVDVATLLAVVYLGIRTEDIFIQAQMSNALLKKIESDTDLLGRVTTAREARR